MTETKEQVWYLVQTMRQWASLEVLGIPLNAHQYPGCVGFVPVFDSAAAAESWRAAHAPSAGIVAMMRAEKEAIA